MDTSVETELNYPIRLPFPSFDFPRGVHGYRLDVRCDSEKKNPLDTSDPTRQPCGFSIKLVIYGTPEMQDGFSGWRLINESKRYGWDRIEVTREFQKINDNA